MARRSLNNGRIEAFLGSLESSSKVDHFQKKLTQIGVVLRILRRFYGKIEAAV